MAAEMASSGEVEREELLVAFGHRDGSRDAQGRCTGGGVPRRARAARPRARRWVWTLPGGWAEVGEKPSRAAEKELGEESGYRGRAVS